MANLYYEKYLAPFGGMSQEDATRLHCSRVFWRSLKSRDMMLAHWNHPEHPSRDRWKNYSAVIEEVLSFVGDDSELDKSLRERKLSLRVVIREIPPIIGSIWAKERAALRCTMLSV